MSVEGKVKPTTISKLLAMKQNGEKIAMLTAYDYTFASIAEQAQMDMILVGDSAANVMAGYETTLPITVDNMIYHAQCVTRAAKTPFVVVDMPFGAYQGNADVAVANAIRIMKETGASAIKMEGGIEIADTIKKIVNCGIPVVGHLGLAPQSINKYGSYGVRAKEQQEAEKLMSDALALQEAGCFAITLEKIPAELATKVTKALDVITIGIGAGNGCDGQVLVMHDMLGLNESFAPKFLRRFAQLHGQVLNAFVEYKEAVKRVDFPNENECY
ncbi:MAG: 3-methyl-2-oxobutanoate hydroxymethyltransferase [Bacteroidales bacterium]|jgi:3-methyl-2-oxobutanoate hydroxymethyltransferase|nr:3-methyl-2-oxobutanoate hydroxymethyltransferase [Bacteroidales bacterium]